MIQEYIVSVIKDNGYIRISQFMEAALTKFDESYYRKKKAVGEDFITAPEISQMFGEVVGNAILSFKKVLKQESINLVELGPGRGTLMRDLLKVCIIEKFAPEAYLLEVNPVLKKIQEKALSRNNVFWISNLSDLPKKPAIFIANEFFDALPITQYYFDGKSWNEVVITIKDKSLIFNNIKTIEEERLKLKYPLARRGCFIEESNASIEITKKITSHVKKYGGMAIIIDYGYDIKHEEKKALNSTLQALKSHNYQSIFVNIGEADVTAHVDFYEIKKIAIKEGIYAYGAYAQSAFLKYFGIDQRFSMLIQNLSEHKDRKALYNQYERLIGRQHMGELFKVIILSAVEI